MPQRDEPTIHQLFDLTGKVAMITGAVGWLGPSMAAALAEAGASVIVTSRQQDRADELAAALPSPGGAKHYGVVLDLMDETVLTAGFAQAVTAADSVDILINNACELTVKDLTNITYDEYIRQLTNIAGTFTLSRLFRDHVVARSAPGNVIMLGSIYGQVASYPKVYEGYCANPVSYQSIKTSMIQLTRHLAVYWAKDRIRVNCLSPGAMPNPKIPKSMVDGINSYCPMGRIGVPHELKGAIAYLASEASAYMTGQNLTVDGGWTAV